MVNNFRPNNLITNSQKYQDFSSRFREGLARLGTDYDLHPHLFLTGTRQLISMFKVHRTTE